MANKNYYDILGVSKTATDAEIKSAYLKLAKKYHPDLNPGDATAGEKLKEVNEAYAVLSDKQKRSNYDNFGSADGFAGASGGGFGGFGSSFSGFGGFEDILGGMFGDIFGSGGGRRKSGPTPVNGQDIDVKVKLTFAEALYGTTKTFRITRNKSCKACHGTGANNGTDFETCTSCNGTGKIRKTQQTIFGAMSTESACTVCGGSGKKIKNKCSTCGGYGYTRVTLDEEVEIPGGIEDGRVLICSDLGHDGKNGGRPGNLRVFVSVAQNTMYTRKDHDLYVDVNVPFTMAILGGELKLPMPDGTDYNLKIEPNTQSGESLTIRGKGGKKINSVGYGNIYVTYIVDVPIGVNKEQKKLVEELAKSFKSKDFPRSLNFFK